MEVTNVACNGCGAALDISGTARFITCRHCGASLEIKRTESAVFTEVLDRIDQRTAAMAEDLDAIRRSQEIEQLDREWNLRREGLMNRSKNGTTSEPSIIGGLLVIFIGGGFGLFWTVGAFSITSRMSGTGAPGPVSIFPFFGIVMICAAIVLGLKSIVNAQRYQDEQAEYQKRRDALAARDPRNLRAPENSPRNP